MKSGSRMVADWKEDQTMAAKLLKFGAPGGIRTPNPQIRSLVLCPIELRARDEAEILSQCAQGLDKIAKTNDNFYEPRLFLYRNNALLKRIDA
jgi:hypothetical protein